MIKNDDFEALKKDFDTFNYERCAMTPEEMEKHNPDEGDPQDSEPVPIFVDELNDTLMAPSQSGVYLSRIDIKRVAEAIDESLPIKERKKMIKALFRHTNSKEYLRSAFDEINRHINGRILIYQELTQSFPHFKTQSNEWIEKAEKMKKMFDQIVEDFEPIEPTDEPMPI